MRVQAVTASFLPSVTLYRQIFKQKRCYLGLLIAWLLSFFSLAQRQPGERVLFIGLLRNLTIWGWRGGAAVRSTYYSHRAPEFSPSSHMGQLNSNFRGSNIQFWSSQELCPHRHVPTADRHTEKSNKSRRKMKPNSRY